MRLARHCLAAVVGGLVVVPTVSFAADLGGPPVRTMTPVEATAHALWSMRAALNVSALQCQFSPFLATVRNYNDMLKQHDAELGSAYKTMEQHFRRLDGAGGRNNFDVFTTRMYNSFSTLAAQYSFCAAAGDVGREVLARRRGDLAGFASPAVGRLRASLVAPPDPYRTVQLGYLPVPHIPDPCVDKRGRPQKRCKL